MTKGAVFALASLALGAGVVTYVATRDKEETEPPVRAQPGTTPPAGQSSGPTLNPNLGPLTLDCGGAPDGFCCLPGTVYNPGDGLCYPSNWRSAFQGGGTPPRSLTSTTGCDCPDCPDCPDRTGQTMGGFKIARAIRRFGRRFA